MTIEVDAIRPRALPEIAGMAVAVQANVVQLRVAAEKRAGYPLDDIRTPAPGAVKRYRETLIEPGQLARYDDAVVVLRLREVWGQHCMFCWFCGAVDPQAPPRFTEIDGPIRCSQAVLIKVLEIEKSLWRCQFEQKMRHDPEFRRAPGFSEAHRAAQQIPVMTLGSSVQTCTDAELLWASCEFAGMLAAGRWITDDRWAWAQDGIMDIQTT